MPNWKKVVISGSNAQLSSLYVDGAVTASAYAGNGSGLTGIVASSASYVSPRGSTQNIIFNDGADYTGSLDLIFNKTDRTLGVNNAATINAITASGALNSYIQLNIQNRSTANTASSDVVATNDTGNELGNYIDFGINGSGYSYTDYIGYANDAYLYNTGSKLIIANATPSNHVSSSIWVSVGGTNARSNLRVVVSSSGHVGINVEKPKYHLEVGGTVSSSNYIGNGSQLTNVTSSFSTTTFTKGLVLSNAIDGVGTNTYHVWLSPITARLVSFSFRYSGSSDFWVNAWKSGSSGYLLHSGSSTRITTPNKWFTVSTVTNTDYAVGDTLVFVVTGSTNPQGTVQADFIRI